MKSYVYVSGGKGGIGKSLMAITLVDYMLNSGPVTLVDGDHINGDSSSVFKNKDDTSVSIHRIQIRVEDATGQTDVSGIGQSINFMEQEEQHSVVVDAPAGDTVLLTSAGDLIIDACLETGYQSVFVWLVDSNDRTPANVLHQTWESLKRANKILLVKNLRKGNNFDYFDNSEFVKRILTESNVSTIELPKLALRLEENIRIDRMNWSDLATKTPLGTRVEANRLRKLLHSSLEGAGL